MPWILDRSGFASAAGGIARTEVMAGFACSKLPDGNGAKTKTNAIGSERHQRVILIAPAPALRADEFVILPVSVFVDGAKGNGLANFTSGRHPPFELTRAVVQLRFRVGTVGWAKSVAVLPCSLFPLRQVSPVYLRKSGRLNNRSSWMNCLAVQPFIFAAIGKSKTVLTATLVSLPGPDAMLFYNWSDPARLR